MAKKDLRAQMDAARAAAAFIDAAHDELESSREMRGEGATKRLGRMMANAPRRRAGIARRNRPSRLLAHRLRRLHRPPPRHRLLLRHRLLPASLQNLRASRTRKPRKKNVEAAPVEEAVEGSGARMTAQVLVPMTAEQREHADLWPR